jgi:hypothetical protein
MAAKTIAFPTRRHASTEKELLTMIMNNAHIHDCAIPGKSVVTLLLSYEQIDRLCSYGVDAEDLEDSHDAEQEDAA